MLHRSDADLLAASDRSGKRRGGEYKTWAEFILWLLTTLLFACLLFLLLVGTQNAALSLEVGPAALPASLVGGGVEQLDERATRRLLSPRRRTTEQSALLQLRVVHTLSSGRPQRLVNERAVRISRVFHSNFDSAGSLRVMSNCTLVVSQWPFSSVATWIGAALE